MSLSPSSPASARPVSPLSRIPGWMWVLGAAGAVFSVATHLMLNAFAPGAEVRFRVDLSPLAAAPPAVQVHVAAALLSFAVGCVILARPKGRGLHRTLGWTWVAAMALTAASSFFITQMMGSSLGPIHALSAWTLIVLPMGVAAIRRRDVAAHRRHMTQSFLGGMVIAGLFTFLPGRLMWSTFFTV